MNTNTKGTQQFIILVGSGGSGKSYFTQNSLHTLKGFDSSHDIKIYRWNEWDDALNKYNNGNTNVVYESNTTDIPEYVLERANHIVHLERNAISV